MNRLSESGKLSPEAFTPLNSSFDFHEGQRKKHADDRNAAWDRFNKSNVEFQKFLLSWMRDMAPKQIPVMVEIRRDLGLTGNLKEMEAQLQQQTLRMTEYFEALISALKSD
jgi:hypothetical protein